MPPDCVGLVRRRLKADKVLSQLSFPRFSLVMSPDGHYRTQHLGMEPWGAPGSEPALCTIEVANTHTGLQGAETWRPVS